MSKQIQAYFKTEDDAEQAKTKLIGIRTEQLEVGRVGTALEGNRRILLPFAPAGMTGSGVTTGSASAAAGVSGAAYPLPVVMSADDEEGDRNGARRTVEEASMNRTEDDGPVLDSEDVFADRYDDLEYVLSCKVQDREYADVVNTLRNHGGYVEIFEDQ